MDRDGEDDRERGVIAVIRALTTRGGDLIQGGTHLNGRPVHHPPHADRWTRQTVGSVVARAGLRAAPIRALTDHCPPCSNPLSPLGAGMRYVAAWSGVLGLPVKAMALMDLAMTMHEHATSAASCARAEGRSAESSTFTDATAGDSIMDRACRAPSVVFTPAADLRFYTRLPHGVDMFAHMHGPTLRPTFLWSPVRAGTLKVHKC